MTTASVDPGWYKSRENKYHLYFQPRDCVVAGKQLITLAKSRENCYSFGVAHTSLYQTNVAAYEVHSLSILRHPDTFQEWEVSFLD